MTTKYEAPLVLADEDGEFLAVRGHATTRKQRFEAIREVWDDHLEHRADDAAYWEGRDGNNPRRGVIKFIRDTYAGIALDYMAPVGTIAELEDEDWPADWWHNVPEDHAYATPYTIIHQ